MLISRLILKKSILTFIVLSVFFWAVVLPSHFHFNESAENDRACCCNLSEPSTIIPTISQVLLTPNEENGHCPLCVLSSMFSIGIAIEDNSSIIAFVNKGALTTETLSYYFNILDILRARAPPTAFFA